MGREHDGAGRPKVKLVIQIPCLNEREHLADTIAGLPRTIEGVDEIEVLVIDDGSTDGTYDRAIELGVHHIVRFPGHRGLSAAFMAGLDAAVRVGADVVVNTDADHQYPGWAIPSLIAPVLAGRAEVVVGDRQTDSIAHFSWFKRALQRWGSRVVRSASGTRVADATSGFRALSRDAALRLFVHNRFTYTVESIIQAGRAGMRVENVVVQTNPKKRESRLFTSVPQYLRRNGPVVIRAYVTYRPVQTFALAAVASLAVGATLVGRFAYYYVQNPHHNGHAQSLILGVGCVILAVLVTMVAMVSDLMAANRRLLEETLGRLRRLDAEAADQARLRGEPVAGVFSTGAAPWRGAQP